MGWKRAFTVAGSLVIIAICAVFVWRTVRIPHPTPADPAPYRGVGEEAARQVSQLLNGQGRVVVWTYPTTSANRDLVESSLAAFKSTLKEMPGLTLVAEERVEAPLVIVHPPGFPQMSEVFTEFPEAEFLRVLAKSAEADAVVSFVVPPDLSQEQMAGLPQRRPKLVVVSLYSEPTAGHLNSGLVEAAIVKQRDRMPQPHEPPPTTPAEWVARDYMVVTPANDSVLSR